MIEEKTKVFVVIKKKNVYFDFQCEDRDFDKRNPQLDLEYLGNELPFYLETKEGKIIYQGKSEYVWRKIDVNSEKHAQ